MSRPSTGAHALADVLDDAAEPVLDDAARAVAAGELLLERELDALLAAVLDVGEADHVRRRLALGVLALVLAHLVHALERRARAPAWRPARRPGGAARRSSGCRRAGRRARPGRHAEQRGELRCAAPGRRRRPSGSPRATAPARWTRGSGRCGRGCGRGWPAARACARSGSRPGAGRTRCRSPARRPRGRAARRSPGRRSATRNLRAPRRRLRRQQRAGRVADAAHVRAVRAPSSARRAAACRRARAGSPRSRRASSWRAPARGARRRGAATYCVTAGVAVRIAACRARSSRRAAAWPATALLGLQALVLGVEQPLLVAAPCRARRTGGATRSETRTR